MQAAERMLSSSAANLAAGVGSTQSADLVGDLVTLTQARTQMQAAVLVERTADQMQKSLLDMFV